MRICKSRQEWDLDFPSALINTFSFLGLLRNYTSQKYTTVDKVANNIQLLVLLTELNNSNKLKILRLSQLAAGDKLVVDLQASLVEILCRILTRSY